MRVPFFHPPGRYFCKAGLRQLPRVSSQETTKGIHHMLSSSWPLYTKYTFVKLILLQNLPNLRMVENAVRADKKETIRTTITS